MKNHKQKRLNDVLFTIGHIKNIHFVGIGGAGMGGIAEILLKKGYVISGSDILSNDITKRLSKLGATVFYNHKAENIMYSHLVVFSTAVLSQNPELLAAQKAKIPIIHRSEILAELMRFSYGIAISGTHGKTTTTAMLASIYNSCGLDPTFISGGLIKSLGIYSKLGSGIHFITEVDESDMSFLKIRPISAIITNIEADHMSTYSNNLNLLKQAFINFVHNLPFYGYVVLCIDNKYILDIIPYLRRNIITYGFNKNANFQIINYRQCGCRSYFTILRYNKTIINITLNIPGKHNALNATAAIAVASNTKIEDTCITQSLSNFQGVARRFDFLGEFSLKLAKNTLDKIILIHDYGHHPTEIYCTIKTARISWPNRRLVMVFQPHRYTRTLNHYENFANVLANVDILLMLDIYSAGEMPIPGVDSYMLCKLIKKTSKINPILISNHTLMIDTIISTLKKNDLLLIQGAGDVYHITNILIKTKLVS